MSFPGIFRRLFQKEGAGPLLRKEIIPPHADTHTADGGDPLDIAALGGVSAEAFMVLQKLFDSNVKKKLTKETVFYVNGETGDDALDEGRGLSPDMAFRTAQAAIDHICGGYDFQIYNCFLDLSEGEFPEFLVIPGFETLTGQLRIRGKGADKTVIRGSILTRHSNGIVALEKSITVKCPESPTPSWTTVWYGVAVFSTGVIDLACTVDAGEDTPSLYKYVAGLAQMGGGVYLSDGCVLKGVCDQFIFANSGAVSILGDVRIEGKARNAVASAVYSGVIAVYTKPDGVSFPTVTGSVEGRRFSAYLGGLISSAGQGPNYFPGTEAGLADTATGGYYG